MKRLCVECGGSGTECAPGPGEEGEAIQCRGCWGWGTIETETPELPLLDSPSTDTEVFAQTR